MEKKRIREEQKEDESADCADYADEDLYTDYTNETDKNGLEQKMEEGESADCADDTDFWKGRTVHGRRVMCGTRNRTDWRKMGEKGRIRYSFLEWEGVP
jgi:hypothetical protein